MVNTEPHITNILQQVMPYPVARKWSMPLLKEKKRQKPF
jgi:hypothetical protein